MIAMSHTVYIAMPFKQHNSMVESTVRTGTAMHIPPMSCNVIHLIGTGTDTEPGQCTMR
jgi:hypothetical protein